MPNPFAHIELSTDDLGQAKEFYRSVFQWKLEDQDMGPGMIYTLIHVGKGVGGGMQKKQMAEQPTAWLPYVEVSDVKATLAKASAGGARVVLDYMEIGEMGAIGVFVDPHGAGLGVWEAAKKAAPRKAAAKKPAAKKATAKKTAPKKAAAKKAAPKKKGRR